jgi:hypothetical protein
MAEDRTGEGLPPGLAALAAQAGKAAPERPVEHWNPPHCGPIDINIAGDGTWFYRGSPISREALVRLFASVLRREPDGEYVLVTPVEKLGIEVEDAPFLAVEMAVDGEGADQSLTFRTNVGDIVTAGPDHPLRFEVEAGTGGLKPYLLVRGRLEALLARQLVFQMAEMVTAAGQQPGVWSGGVFFAFPEASG